MSIATNETITASDINSLLKSYSNYYLTGTEFVINWSSDVLGAYGQADSSATRIVFEGVGLPIQRRLISADWAAADLIRGMALYGAYVYVLMVDSPTNDHRLYRYDKTNLAAGGTLMTVATQAFGTTSEDTMMTMDASGNFYFTNQAGGSASNHIISKYSLSGTTITHVSNTTCGATSSNFERILWVDGSGNFYGWNYSVDNIPRKYNSSGTLVTTYALILGDCSAQIAGNIFVRKSNTAAGGEVYSKINL